MGTDKKSDNFPAELSVPEILDGVLTLEQSEIKQWINLTRKALKNKDAQNRKNGTPSNLEEGFRKNLKTKKEDRKMNELKTTSSVATAIRERQSDRWNFGGVPLTEIIESLEQADGFESLGTISRPVKQKVLREILQSIVSAETLAQDEAKERSWTVRHGGSAALMHPNFFWELAEKMGDPDNLDSVRFCRGRDSYIACAHQFPEDKAVKAFYAKDGSDKSFFGLWNIQIIVKDNYVYFKGDDDETFRRCVRPEGICNDAEYAEYPN